MSQVNTRRPVTISPFLSLFFFFFNQSSASSDRATFQFLISILDAVLKKNCAMEGKGHWRVLLALLLAPLLSHAQRWEARAGLVLPSTSLYIRNAVLPAMLATWDTITKTNSTYPPLEKISTNISVAGTFVDASSVVGGGLMAGIQALNVSQAHLLIGGGFDRDFCSSLDLVASAYSVLFLGTYCPSGWLRNRAVHPNFFSPMASETAVVNAIVALSLALDWRRIGLIYENNIQGLFRKRVPNLMLLCTAAVTKECCC